jgi:coatomer subunit delta
LLCQNKEAEAKEELKRRAKQLEMQRREQQRRATAAGGPGANYLGGGISGYAPVPQRYEAPTPVRAASPAASSLRAPTFKKSGMQLGGKKTTQSQLLDALGDEALLSEDMSVPGTPAPMEHTQVKAVQAPRSSLPTITPERYDRLHTHIPGIYLDDTTQRARCRERNYLPGALT